MKGMILKNTALPSSAHSDPYHNEWKKLWSMATIPRHKALIWRIIQQAIPVRSALSKRGVQCLILCPRCLQKEETINHVFMDCHHTSKIWFGSKLGVNFGSYQWDFIG
ncbi:hypothetical protein L195_g041817 [Trifolium pratense]|uniref:Reverse transcriptase zinc-binding domain-containing protein n=1 Tax=Trifolium pratense TaxID=57577 RepID=A0A2K3M4R0_TRIPR|nr:hypothetical protein L195_g039869 [Trifolium pratense]PNX85743.1 hypothetical protein L195_g041817 [Trifolium pratense]